MVYKRGEICITCYYLYEVDQRVDVRGNRMVGRRGSWRLSRRVCRGDIDVSHTDVQGLTTEGSFYIFYTDSKRDARLYRYGY